MKQVESSLNLDLSLPRSLRPCWGQGVSACQGWAGEKDERFEHTAGHVLVSGQADHWISGSHASLFRSLYVSEPSMLFDEN
jgi:hypothetical protein